jgi:hypothetical protein
MPSGGAILSKRSMDGCVFSNPTWPDTHKSYDVNDKTIVSKIIKIDDNEYDTIKIAQHILGINSNHILRVVGEAYPEEKYIVANEYDTPGMRDNLESLNELKISQANDPNRGACYKLAKADNMDEYKMLISYVYSGTLRAYAMSYHSEKAGVKLIEAGGPFIDALNTLAIRKDGDSLINLDLHSENIFVNLYGTYANHNLLIGMADFGRCMVYKKDSPINSQTWITNFVKYCYSLNLRDFPAVSFEVRLFSYMLKKDIYDIITINKVRDDIYTSIWNNFIDHMDRDKESHHNYPTIYFLKAHENIISQAYIKFIKHVIKHIESFMEMVEDKYNTDNIHNSEIEELIQFMYLRTAGIGFLGTLISMLQKTDIDIASKVDKFIHGEYTSFGTDLYSRVFNVYALEVLAPYKEDHTIHTLYTKETTNRCYKTYMYYTSPPANNKPNNKATTRKRPRNNNKEKLN